MDQIIFNNRIKTKNLRYSQQIIRDPRIGQYTGEKIVQKLTQKSLISLEQMMKQYPSFKITEFMRFFLKLLKPTQEQQIFLAYGLFRLFKDLCKGSKLTQISFRQISSVITDRMPSVNQQIRIRQKLLPMQLDIPQQYKQKILPPQVQGKVLQQRQRLQQFPYKYDKRQHTNRRIAKAANSQKNGLYFNLDSPSSQIQMMNEKLDIVKVFKTQLQISKRDAVITHIVWSQYQQRIAALLGNFSISLWAKDDDFRFQVNVPIPTQFLPNPYVLIGYMESSKAWYAIDNKPNVHILSSYNFQPSSTFKHSKLKKIKQTQKILTLQIKYRKLLCLAFQRNVFLISLQRKQIVTDITNYPTTVTSIAFSEAYQAFFVSTFESYFISYQLSQYLDLTEKGKFEGHKSVISVLATLQNKPVVISLQDNSLLKLWDIRDFQCFQTFSVLKNIMYNQILTMPNQICLVGSKMYLYRLQHQEVYEQPQKVLLMSILAKQFLIVTNKSIRLYNHYSGALTKIVQGQYGQTDIYIAYLIQERSRLLISDEQGNLKIYDSSDMIIVNQKKIDPRPLHFHFDDDLELLTYCCLGNIYISQYINDNEITIRRKILNQKGIINYLSVSGQHDLLVVNYIGDQNLYFYTFQKGKIVAYLTFKDFVKFLFFTGYHMFAVLTHKKLQILSYKKNATSSTLTFFTHYMIDLWKVEDILQLGVPKSNSKVTSFTIKLFQVYLFLASTDAGIYQIFKINLSKMNSIIKGDPLPLMRQNYNPYRISIEKHNQIVQTLNIPVIIDQSLMKSYPLQYTMYYQRLRGQTNFVDRVGDFIMISDTHNNLYLSELPNQFIGCINLKDSLPKFWNVHHYTQKDLKQIDFILDFLENQKVYIQSLKNSNPITQLGQFSFKKHSFIQRKNDGVTLGDLVKQSLKSKSIKSYKSCSLRQKKIVLEKQRDQKFKQQAFQQHRKLQMQSEEKLSSRKLSQKQIADTMNYLSSSYNQILLKKGINQKSMPPQVKRLDQKLSNVIMKDEKKSVVSKISKISGGIYSNQESPNKIATNSSLIISKVKSIMDLIQQTKRQFTQPKVLIKKLNQQLQQSKNKKQIKNFRQASLPSLKKTY